MESLKIEKFLSINSSSSLDDGSGYGSDDGSGYGSGYCSGYGSGYCSGCCSSSDSVYGSSSSYGSSPGSGSISCSGYGYGRGGIIEIKKYNQFDVHLIDSIQTIIASVFGNLAKGFIVKNDLTLSPCFIAKGNGYFAHGNTAKEAVDALQEKIYSQMDTDDAIDQFLNTFDFEKKYPAKAFYKWHHILTGSCEMGRNHFVEQHGIDLDKDMYTVQEFIDMTKNDYGGDIILKIQERKS